MKIVTKVLMVALALLAVSCKTGAPARQTGTPGNGSSSNSGGAVESRSQPKGLDDVPGFVNAVESRPQTKGLGGVPGFVNEAYLAASDDLLIGIGTYKVGSDVSRISLAKNMAETRARADISRQLQTIMQNMITDYTVTSELDPKAALSFQETITQALSKRDLRGARTVKMDTVDGVLWLIMEYSKSQAAEDYNAASSAAKLAVPATAAFDALSRMENAFNKAAAGGPVPQQE
jgi:hypothetical protein